MSAQMPTVTLAAPAKTNLALDVLGRRSDGFHNLETIFQALWLSDTVTVHIEPGEGTRLFCSDTSLPTDVRNLAFRAAEAVRSQRDGPLGAVTITLQKNIPHAAGLGGGSSDAGAVLRALSQLDPHVAQLDLRRIALSLGSDVPFFLMGGTAHALGRGEILSPLSDIGIQDVTVLMPACELSTPTVFNALTNAERGPRPAVGASVWADRLRSQPLTAVLHNRLSAAARRCSPLVMELLDWLEGQRIPHILSGSGAACIAFAHMDPPIGVRAWKTNFRPRAELDRL